MADHGLKLVPGYYLQLIPLDPPPAMPGLTLVGVINWYDPPILSLFFPESGDGLLFRIQNEETAVMLPKKGLFGIGRVGPWFGIPENVR